VALYQLRPCTFIFAGNNLLVARALSAIEHGGAPPTQRFLPLSVFSADNLQTAAWIVTISLGTLLLFLAAVRRQPAQDMTQAPAVPRWLLRVMVFYFIAYAAAGATIFSQGYASSAPRYDFELAGGHTFICAIVIYELARRRRVGQLTARKAFALVFVLFAAIGYARGTTGLTTGFLITSAILLLPRGGSSRRLKDLARIVAVVAVVVAMSFVVRGARAALAAEGADAVSALFDSLLRMEQERDETGEGAEAVANASQSAAHMLETITLYDAGISRDWRSIYNVVEYTLMPSFLVRWLGWRRSIEPAWELRDHFIHGGGINVLGELYWNGGWLCVVIISMALSLFCAVVDTRYRQSAFWLMMVAQFGPSLLMGYGYGFPQVSRGAINGLVIAGFYRIYSMVRATPPSVLVSTVPEPPPSTVR
jgi:hypothetical protein